MIATHLHSRQVVLLVVTEIQTAMEDQGNWARKCVNQATSGRRGPSEMVGCG